MSDRPFSNPVYVRDSTRLIREISCLEDALEFLYEWPKKRRGPIYQTALRACHSVIEHGYPLSAARDAVEGFCRSARILEEVSLPMPWSVMDKHRVSLSA